MSVPSLSSKQIEELHPYAKYEILNNLPLDNKQIKIEGIIMELIPNTDFGQTLANESDADYRRLRDNFDKFCKQQLTLGMFVPCYFSDGIWIPYTKDMLLNSIELFNEFEKAKERVLFEVFEKIGENELSITLECKDTWFEYYKEEDLFMCGDAILCTIEDLASYSLTLTQTAINTLNE